MVTSAWMPGMKWVKKLVGNQVPKKDPNKAAVMYRPIYTIVKWEGKSDGHTVQECACERISDTGTGKHEERRPAGFYWENRHFNSLVEAENNQAFMEWYKDGGKEIMAEDKLVLRPLQYTGDDPPRPRYGFYFHEHERNMSRNEIQDYRKTGEIPSRYMIGRPI